MGPCRPFVQPLARPRRRNAMRPPALPGGAPVEQ
uniref:Uncharacterized protein n=1 Tax=Ulva partita TaxID=1605170 RepID=A0A1C9ZPL0_9CHLO|nr:hypothetical protein [Ulva partita]